MVRDMGQSGLTSVPKCMRIETMRRILWTIENRSASEKNKILERVSSTHCRNNLDA